MNSGPLISSSVGRLIACTWPHRCPLLSPRSRNHLPPGHGSIFIGKGLPSGVSPSGPICSSSAAKVVSRLARTWISLIMTIVKFSSADAVASDDILPPLSISAYVLRTLDCRFRRVPSPEATGASRGVRRFSSTHAGDESLRHWFDTACVSHGASPEPALHLSVPADAWRQKAAPFRCEPQFPLPIAL